MILQKSDNHLHQRDMGLILDFVPNHTAIDHPWVSEHPEYYILGSAQDFRNRPESFFRVEARGQNYYHRPRPRSQFPGLDRYRPVELQQPGRPGSIN